MATPKKKTSKKRKAKKARKSPRATRRQEGGREKARRQKQARREKGRQDEEGCQENCQEDCKENREEDQPKKAAKEIFKEALEETGEDGIDEAAPIRPATAKVTVAKAPAAPKSPRLLRRARSPHAATPPADVATRNTYFVTTPIFYPNGVPHIGHAYTAMVTDAIARFQRLDGFDVLFLTGTDEHGLKMQQTAVAEGLTPIALADRNSARFRDMMTALNISYDDYIRTTEPRHERACQACGVRSRRTAISISTNTPAGIRFVRRLISTKRKPSSATTVSAANRWARRSSGPRRRRYFFRLSAYQDRLLDLYARIPDFVLPRERLNEVASFVKGGLQDLSVSRTTFDWGIKVPGAPAHVMYVWMDALTNYITAAGYPEVDSAEFQRYWPASLHVTGKDIVRFHAVYWPAFLMSAGVAVPQRVFSHGFLLNRGEKMSKSVGNVVDPFAMAAQYGVDQVRYFFMREVSFGQDGSYNHEAIVARTNADLANDLGNLAQRSLSMIAKQLGGVLPEPGDFTDNDKAILAQADAMLEASRSAMATQQIHQWLNAVWAVVAEANRYFAGEAPWALAKTDPARQKTVLYVTAEVVRQVAILAQPAMPESAAKLLDSLGVPKEREARDFAALATRLTAGTALPAPVGVFPRYVEPKTD